MKKFMVILFVLFVAAFSVFAEPEQIGTRLKYEVKYSFTNQYDFQITDAYAKDWYYYFSFNRSMETTFDIKVNYKNIGTAELYSDDFKNIIIQYITSTARDGGGNAEWIQYASTIADKMAEFIKSRNPAKSPPPPPPQSWTYISYSGQMSGSQIYNIWLVIGITSTNDVVNSFYSCFSNGIWGDRIGLTGNIINGKLTLYEKEQYNWNLNRAVFIFDNFNVNSNSIVGIRHDIRSNFIYTVQLSKQ